MEEVANPIAKASFDRVEPVVEKMYRRLGFGLRQARRRAIARHGVISAGVPTPESLVGPSWRLRRLQFPTTPATAPVRGFGYSHSIRGRLYRHSQNGVPQRRNDKGAFVIEADSHRGLHLGCCSLGLERGT